MFSIQTKERYKSFMIFFMTRNVVIIHQLEAKIDMRDYNNKKTNNDNNNNNNKLIITRH